MAPPLTPGLDQVKVTSPDFDAAPSIVFCRTHPDVQQAKDWEATLWESWQHDEFRLVRAKCQACLRAEEAAAERRYWSRRGVPDRVVDATLATFRVSGDGTSEKKKALTDATAFVAHAAAPINLSVDTSTRQGGFLLLVGSTGTGKGHLAVAVMKALQLTGGGLFTTHADLLTDLRASYKTGGTATYLEKLKSAPCLILDEFGLAASGADEAPVLYQVIADRHDKRRPTIITSNEELPTLKQALGSRLVDRIREDCTTIVCRWKSFRQQGKA